MSAFTSLRFLLIFITALLGFIPVWAADEVKVDTMYLINREPRCIEYLRADSQYVYFKKPGRNREKSIEIQSVYGIRKADGSFLVLYVQDTLEGNWYTKEQMISYMRGQDDAIKHYKQKANRAGYLGLTVGFAGSAAGIYYAPVIATGYAVLRAYTKPSFKEKWGFNSNFSADPAYVEGFGTMAKRYTSRRSALGAVSGFVAGTITLTLILSQ
jgi:hypothetical protein